MRQSLGVRRTRFGIGVVALGLPLVVACTTPGRDAPDLTWRKARIHYNIGLDHLSKGRTALAIRELKLADQLDSRDAWTSLALAEAYRRKARFDDAERYLQHALELDGAFQPAQLNLGALYIQQKRFEEAVALLAPLADDPTFPSPWRALTNLGWAEFKLGRNADSRRHLELALDYQPTYWPALLDLGILEAQEGHVVEALHLFEQVLQERQGARAEAEAHYRMGELYVSLGRREQAIEHLSASKQRYPRGPWGKRSAEYLKILR